MHSCFQSPRLLSLLCWGCKALRAGLPSAEAAWRWDGPGLQWTSPFCPSLSSTARLWGTRVLGCSLISTGSLESRTSDVCWVRGDRLREGDREIGDRSIASRLADSGSVRLSGPLDFAKPLWTASSPSYSFVHRITGELPLPLCQARFSTLVQSCQARFSTLVQSAVGEILFLLVECFLYRIYFCTTLEVSYCRR